MGCVVDMTGRVLESDEQVTEGRQEQQEEAQLQAIWDEAPKVAKGWADHHGVPYPDAVAMIVHSLLCETREAAKIHDSAQGILDFIGDRFYGPGQ